MGVTSYYSFGGEIIGEETGGVRRDYLTDALGSVTATVTGAGVVENTYRYKPYGEQLAKTGTGGDPKFLWNGRTGYRQMNNPFSSIYVRARHYATSSGRWTTGFRGGLIRSVNDYLYALANPLEYVEPTGSYAYQNPKQKKPKQKIDPWESGNCQKAKESAKAELGKCFNAKDMDTLADIMMCMAFGESDCSGKGTSPLGMYQQHAPFRTQPRLEQ